MNGRPESVHANGGAGIAAAELFERNRLPHATLTAGSLEAWLLAEHLAVVDDAGRLTPTRRALELGGALE